ncbi:MAG TPA: stage II sporulation protein M [Phnomibacter sp.]|nr:stage II sporulation protein M [Phnomibacter sp.]
MREALFIKRNRDKWIRYQREQTQDPDEQAERFITLLDDLAYSRTFYPQSKVTRWINNIAVGIYQTIYQNKKERFGRLLSFWTTELPLLVRRHHRTFLFTFIFFAICIAIAVASSRQDDFFVKAVLGEDYVLMTEENISKGDPFGVYKDDNQFYMFVRIASNNIQIALKTFIYGIFFGLGSLYILFQNGIMVGAFEYMFFSHGVGWKSILVVWVHGTIEISIIVISGAAGLIVGSSILFPGTYSRFQSFKRGVRDALKIALASIPFLIVAAILESYVTHLMGNTFTTKGTGGLPVWAGVLILAASCFLIVWYFGWYPIQVQRKVKLAEAQNKKQEPKTLVWP